MDYSIIFYSIVVVGLLSSMIAIEGAERAIRETKAHQEILGFWHDLDDQISEDECHGHHEKKEISATRPLRRSVRGGQTARIRKLNNPTL
jgi:hypothetical protein